jgi:hypothetical protein
MRAFSMSRRALVESQGNQSFATDYKSLPATPRDKPRDMPGDSSGWWCVAIFN